MSGARWTRRERRFSWRRGSWLQCQQRLRNQRVHVLRDECCIRRCLILIRVVGMSVRERRQGPFNNLFHRSVRRGRSRIFTGAIDIERETTAQGNEGAQT